MTALDEAAIVAITDTRGKIIYCNDRFCTTSGYSREELVGAPHSIVNSGLHDRAYFVGMYRTLRTGQVWRGTIRNRRKDGGFYWVDTTIVPQMGEGGVPEAYIAIRFDVTAHILALEELAEARRRSDLESAAKDRLLANMSHELRTPLTAVIGVGDLLDATELNPTQRDFVDTIRQASGMLHAIVNDVLTMAQADAEAIVLAPVSTAPREMIGGLVRLLGVTAVAKGLRLDARIAPGVPSRVMVDRLRLTQVLTNLIGNAIKFTDAGQVTVSVDWRDDRLSCEVSDTGRGFDPAQKSRLFRAFEQVVDANGAHAQGSGLGLAIAARLVAALGGVLDADSVPRAGSRFWFQIPCSAMADVDAPEAASGGRSLEAPPIARVQRKVLVVEDNPVNQTIIRSVLESAGCLVETADNGAEGLGMLRATPADLCFMDLRMPVMDGWAAIAAIRADEDARVRQTPVIALSADIVRADEQAIQAAGFDAFLPKPIDVGAILQVVAGLADNGDNAACAAAPDLTHAA